MSLHPEYQAMLQQLADVGGPSLTEMSVVAAREMMRMGQPPRPDVKVGKVLDSAVEGPNGTVPIRVYVPLSSGPYPMIFMFHGGGWVIGDLDTADGQSREVCLGTDSIVISVDYRLAPENKFPAAPEDCFAVVLAHEELAAKYNGDVKRMAVAGDSAGGNLAAVVALMARDRQGPELSFQLLVYPVTDGVNKHYPSLESNAEGYMLTTEGMTWFWDHYCSVKDRSHAYASPVLADDLSNLPPALVLTAEYDPLRDEGEAYGERLKQAGNDVTIKRYDGFIHGFFGHSLALPSTKGAMNDACSALKEALTQ